MQTQHARGDPFPTAGAGKAGPGRRRVCGPGGGGEEMVVVWNAPVRFLFFSENQEVKLSARNRGCGEGRSGSWRAATTVRNCFSAEQERQLTGNGDAGERSGSG